MTTVDDAYIRDPLNWRQGSGISAYDERLARGLADNPEADKNMYLERIKEINSRKGVDQWEQ